MERVHGQSHSHVRVVRVTFENQRVALLCLKALFGGLIRSLDLMFVSDLSKMSTNSPHFASASFSLKWSSFVARLMYILANRAYYLGFRV